MSDVMEKEPSETEPNELEQINHYTRRPLTADEVYIFSVVLCDNEVDRDFERFTIPALRELGDLFLGKTGIFDHAPKTGNQTARIFATHLETDDQRRTRAGEAYTRLVARAYLPRCGKNDDLILEIDSGMKKEVSVGCAMSRRTCSVCGVQRGTQTCSHQKGKAYSCKGKSSVCHDILDQPTDAYEWSFVAVPAQREAGVIKRFSSESWEPCQTVEQLLKQMESAEEELILSKGTVRQFSDHIRSLETLAEQGRQYRKSLTDQMVKFCHLAQPDVSTDVMRRAADNLSLEDLQELTDSFAKKARALLPMKPQLMGEEKTSPATENQVFQI